MSALAVAAYVVVVMVPGALLYRAWRPSAGWLATVATSPLLAFGLVHCWALVLDALGIGVRAVTIVPVTLGVPLIALVMSRRRTSVDRPRRIGFGRPDSVLVAVTAAVAFLLWWQATAAAWMVPAAGDGTNHGMVAARILFFHTADPRQLFAPDGVPGQTATAYYPLALHTSAAVMSSLTGAQVGMSLTVATVMSAAVTLPLGVAILTRRLFPDLRWAAPAAAVVSVAFPVFPYFVASWGGIAMIAGMALVPAALALVTGAVDDGPPVRSGLLVGLALVTLLGVHSSELVVVLALGALLLAGDVVRRGRSFARALLVPGGVAAAVLLAFVLPQLSLLRGGVAERTALKVPAGVGPLKAAGYAVLRFFLREPHLAPAPSWRLGLVLLGLGVLLLLCIVGLVHSLVTRTRPEWAIGLLALVAVTMASAMRLPGADLLTFPWYSLWDRVVANELFFIATYAGVGAAVAMSRLATSRCLVPRFADARGPALLGVAAVSLVAVPAAPQLFESQVTVETAYAQGSLADSQARDAWAYLRAHLRPGERVLNDANDGSGWMYMTEQVLPVFPSRVIRTPAWAGRIYLLNHAGGVESDPVARRAADQWNVEWAYVGPRSFPHTTSVLTPAEFQRSSAWRTMFVKDGAYVFERIDRPGGA